MNAFLRNVLATLAASIAAFITIGLLQYLNGLLFPLPEDTDFTDAAVVATIIERLPAGAIVGLLVSYIVGSGVGGAMAAWLGEGLGAAIAVGVVLTLAGFANLASLPHPLWLAVLTTLIYIPCAVGVGLWVRSRAS